MTTTQVLSLCPVYVYGPRRPAALLKHVFSENNRFLEAFLLEHVAIRMPTLKYAVKTLAHAVGIICGGHDIFRRIHGIAHFQSPARVTAHPSTNSRSNCVLEEANHTNLTFAATRNTILGHFSCPTYAISPTLRILHTLWSDSLITWSISRGTDKIRNGKKSAVRQLGINDLLDNVWDGGINVVLLIQHLRHGNVKCLAGQSAAENAPRARSAPSQPFLRRGEETMCLLPVSRNLSQVLVSRKSKTICAHMLHKKHCPFPSQQTAPRAQKKCRNQCGDFMVVELGRSVRRPCARRFPGTLSLDRPSLDHPKLR